MKLPSVEKTWRCLSTVAAAVVSPRAGVWMFVCACPLPSLCLLAHCADFSLHVTVGVSDKNQHAHKTDRKKPNRELGDSGIAARGGAGDRRCLQPPVQQ